MMMILVVVVSGSEVDDGDDKFMKIQGNDGDSDDGMKVMVDNVPGPVGPAAGGYG